MVINYEKWVNSKIKNSLVDTSKEIENNIVYWDQDVMNKYLDGEYLELPMQLNQHPFNFKIVWITLLKILFFSTTVAKINLGTKKVLKIKTQFFIKNFTKKFQKKINCF